MDQQEMVKRTREYAVRIIRLVSSLPHGKIGDILGRQVLKSGTSIGANYREAIRASSRRHFITTLEIVQREAEETQYWLELLVDAEVVPPTRLKPLLEETAELQAIVTASIRTAKRAQPR